MLKKNLKYLYANIVLWQQKQQNRQGRRKLLSEQKKLVDTQRSNHLTKGQKTTRSPIEDKGGNMNEFIKKQITDIKKFSFGEMTSNSDGKTSSSGTMGVLIISVGTLCFLLGSIDKVFINKDVDIITQSIIFVGMGVALLGYRKSKDNSSNSSDTTEETKN